MRKFVLFAAALTFSGAAQAETILASVNGMVCAFCTIGIEKSFKKQAAVADVHVDLEKKLVTVNTKPEQTLDDAAIAKVIKAAGYSLVSVTRK